MINSETIRQHLNLGKKVSVGEVTLERFKKMMKSQDKDFRVTNLSYIKIDGKEVSVAHYQGHAQLIIKGRKGLVGTKNYTATGVIFAV